MGDQAGAHAVQATQRLQGLRLLVQNACDKRNAKRSIRSIGLLKDNLLFSIISRSSAGVVYRHQGVHKYKRSAGFRRGFSDAELPSFVVGNGIARIKHDTGDRSITSRIEAILSACRKRQCEHAYIQSNNHATLSSLSVSLIQRCDQM
ncbi:MAG: hypothetical protein ACR5LD_09275 [Symbiopectobacterium sp.]